MLTMLTRLILITLTLLALTGCRQSAGGLPTDATSTDRLTLTTDPVPPTIGVGALRIGVRDEDGAPLTPDRIASVQAVGNMNHAGMRPVTAQAVAPAIAFDPDGVLRLPFDFTMGGDWFIDVTVTLTDGTALTRRFDLSVR